jgi:hypothetical protein
MKLRAIPPVPNANSPRDSFDAAVKENLEVITGRRGEKIAPLNASTATLADVVAKVNEILNRIQ